jgi:general secretion pathway protein J
MTAMARPQARPLHAAAREAGLTLVEVLVAFAIFSLLAVMSWRALESMSRVRETAHRHADHTLSLQAGLGQWRADLDAQQESGIVSTVDFDGQVLRITRRAPADGAGLVLAAWALRSGGDGIPSWQRWVSGPLRTRGELRRAWRDAGQWAQSGPASAAAASVSAAGAGTAAVAPVAGWQLFYFRNNAWSNPQSSAQQAAEEGAGGGNESSDGSAGSLPGGTRLQAPPDGVRLALTLAPAASGGTLAGRIVRDWVRPTLDAAR